jgi:hypothetical protein
LVLGVEGGEELAVVGDELRGEGVGDELLGEIGEIEFGVGANADHAFGGEESDVVLGEDFGESEEPFDGVDVMGDSGGFSDERGDNGVNDARLGLRGWGNFGVGAVEKDFIEIRDLGEKSEIGAELGGSGFADSGISINAEVE